MHLEFLVEEESAEMALRSLVPKIVGSGVSFGIHTFQGKQDLLSNLPKRLRGYRRWLPQDWRIVVLVDQDRERCEDLKSRLEKIAQKEGFITWSKAPFKDSFQVLNRIAVEELEAWFLGDITALAGAYPRILRKLANKPKYRNPDAISGAWETLERLLQRANYYRGSMPKIEVARLVAQHMLPDRNRSRSFQVFRDALQWTVSFSGTTLPSS